MNDRLSAFCTGIGVGGLLVGYAMLSGSHWILAVLAAWAVVLLPIGIVDAVCDWWGKRA